MGGGAFAHSFLFVVCFFGPDLSSLVRGAPNATVIRDMLTSHFSQPRHHVTNPQYKMAAMEFIKSQFEDMGLTVVNHTFNTSAPGVDGVNVIGVLKGVNFNNQNDSVLAVSAHYDTVRNSPGVNDNGAAVAVMLETARELTSLSAIPRTSTVLFIAFDFEEGELESDSGCAKSMCGSQRLVEEWLPDYFQYWPDLTWKGLANMDTILNFDDNKNTQKIPDGFNFIFPEEITRLHSDQMEGDFLAMAGRTPEDQALLKAFNMSWFRQGHAVYEIEVFHLSNSVRGYAGDFKRSDHSEFWNLNLSAIFLTDTANYRGYMRRCYHQECDNMTFVTDERLQFAEKVSRSLVSWVDLMAPLYGANVAALLSPGRLSTLVAAFVVIVTLQGILRQRFP